MSKSLTVGLLAIQFGLALFVVAIGAGERGGQRTGLIVGTVTIDEDDVPEMQMVDVTADQGVCGTEVEDQVAVVDPSGGVANAVIIVSGAPWGDIKPVPVINNVGCYFVPRVQVAATRSVITLTSEDDILHTTHAYDDRQRTLFNIAIPVPGLKIERPLRRPGPVRIECDSHRWMRGWVYVTDDIGVVTGRDGRFELSGISPGSYELTVWHERFEGQGKRVTVSAGSTAEASFSLR